MVHKFSDLHTEWFVDNDYDDMIIYMDFAISLWPQYHGRHWFDSLSCIRNVNFEDESDFNVWNE